MSVQQLKTFREQNIQKSLSDTFTPNHQGAPGARPLPQLHHSGLELQLSPIVSQRGLINAERSSRSIRGQI